MRTRPSNTVRRIRRPGIFDIVDAPSLDMDLRSGMLDPAIAFTRSTSGTYMTGTGIASAGVNVPRFDVNALNGRAIGLLIEQEATNLFTNSASPAAGTVRTNCTVGTAIAAPDGANAGFPITVTTGGSATLLRTGTITISATSLTASCFVKKNVQDVVDFTLFNNTTLTAAGTGTFTFSTGAVSASGMTMTATFIGDGWYRITCSDTWPSGNGLRFYMGYTGGTSYSTGDSFYIWGVQVETGPFATSHIPTAGTSVQRTADVALVSGAGLSSFFNASSGTMFAECVRPITSDFGRALSANDNTADEAIDLGGSTAGRFLVRDGGSDVADLTAGTVTANSSFRVAGAYASNYAQIAFNGTVGTPDVSLTLPVIDRLMVGRNAAVTPVYFNGNISRIAYWPFVLSDTQLQAITT